MESEIDVCELPVTGLVPRELDGRYLRNGPNPLPGQSTGHWFIGAGMLHGIRLSEGRALWYRNRWVRTAALDGAPRYDADGNRDLAVNSSNTSIIEHAGRLLSLCEDGFPYEVDGDLGTRGPHDFDGRLGSAFTAHPKIDPATGELHAFGYGQRPPYVTYHRVSADGTLLQSDPIDVPAATMMHDFAITEDHIVWLDLPLVFDRDLVGRTMPYAWRDDYGARIGVMRQGTTDVMWFDVDPCYVFHVGNACEDAYGRIVLDAVRYGRTAWHNAWQAVGGRDPEPATNQLVDAAAAVGVSVLYRWTLDPGTGRHTENLVDDRALEFPTINDERVGLSSRYVYGVASGERDAVVKYDTDTGHREAHRLQLGNGAGEAVFVPAVDGSNEDDGWLLSIVSARDESGAGLEVLDATDVAAGPVATVELPRWVPPGFHGSWIAE